MSTARKTVWWGARLRVCECDVTPDGFEAVVMLERSHGRVGVWVRWRQRVRGQKSKVQAQLGRVRPCSCGMGGWVWDERTSNGRRARLKTQSWPPNPRPSRPES